MGNYNLKSGVFRCDNCSNIYRMTIEPGLPESFVNLDCKCSTSRTSIKNFLSELSKGTKQKILCFGCRKQKKENKNPTLYCNDCNHIYCQKCINKEHESHKYISLIKLDFYCIFHKNENFFAFCKDCDINLCQKCIENKRHLNHDVVEYDKIMMNKTERDFLKDKFNLAQEKLTFNTSLVNTIAKKLKNKEEADKIINLGKDNSEQNKIILELINFFMYLYDNSKLKNYNIIHNFIENVNLNVNKLKLWDKSIKIEEVLDKLTKYLEKDFILINQNDDQEDIFYNDNKETNPSNKKEQNKKMKKETKKNNTAFKEKTVEVKNIEEKNDNKLLNNNNSKINSKIIITDKNKNKDDKNNNEDIKIKNNTVKIPKNDKVNEINTNINNKTKKEKEKDKNNNIQKNDEKINLPKTTDKLVEKKENIESVKLGENKINEEKKGKEEKKENFEKIEKEIKERKKDKEINEEKKEKEEKKENEEKKEKEIKEIKERKKEKEIKEEIREKEIKEEIKEKEIKEGKKEKEIKEEKTEKSEENKIEEVKKVEIETENIHVNNGSNKYIDYFSVNRFRNKYNSVVNLMMINGFHNKKIFNFNLN